MYHGLGRDKTARALKRYNVVLTTYATMAREAPVQPIKAGGTTKKPIDLCEDSSSDDDDSDVISGEDDWLGMLFAFPF